MISFVLNHLNCNYFNTANWQRFDSGHYLSIATKGYELFPCDSKNSYSINGKEMCGNTGWFPGYPFLIKSVDILFNDALLIAGLLSKLFYILSLFMVLKLAQIKEITFRNILFVLLAAFNFGFIYYNAIFPVSAVLFFVLAALYFFIRRKIVFTGLFCFLAAFFYPSGILLSLVFTISVLLRKNERIKQKVSSLIIPALLGGLGIVCVFFIFQLTVNDWTAFFKVQAKNVPSLHSPIKNMESFFALNSLVGTFSMRSFIQYQSMLVIVGYIVLSFYFFLKRMFNDELYLWAYIYVTLFLIFQWTIGGNLSMYRAESLLLPFVFLLKELNSKWIAFILIILLSIGIPMTYLFFNNVLV